jgi:hypothetical protein
MRLGDRDHQKWPAMGFEGSTDDRFPVAKPRLMDERTPAPTAVPPLAMDRLSATRTQLSIGGRPWRSDLSDQFFRAPEKPPAVRPNRPERPSAALHVVERRRAGRDGS